MGFRPHPPTQPHTTALRESLQCPSGHVPRTFHEFCGLCILCMLFYVPYCLPSQTHYVRMVDKTVGAM